MRIHYTIGASIHNRLHYQLNFKSEISFQVNIFFEKTMEYYVFLNVKKFKISTTFSTDYELCLPKQ